MTDFEAHLTRQVAFSRATFGPGERTKGIIDHICKETAEVLAEKTPGARAKEWVDLVILSLDGLWRAVEAEQRVSLVEPRLNANTISAEAMCLIQAKQSSNEMRTWPDWRQASPDKAIEHVRAEATNDPSWDWIR